MEAIKFIQKNKKCVFVIDSDVKDIIKGKNISDKMIKYNKKSTNDITKIKNNNGIKSPRKLILEYVNDKKIQLHLGEGCNAKVIECIPYVSDACFTIGDKNDKLLKFMTKIKLFKQTVVAKKTQFLRATNGNFTIRIVLLGPEHDKIKKNIPGLYSVGKNNDYMSLIFSSSIYDGKQIVRPNDPFTIKGSYTCISQKVKKKEIRIDVNINDNDRT